MPVGRREEIRFDGSFEWGVGPGPPTMQDNGQVVPGVAIAFSEPGLIVTATFTEASARRLIDNVAAALAEGHRGLIIPGKVG